MATLGVRMSGWISFNCFNTNTCGTSDYKVNLGSEPRKVPETCSDGTKNQDETGIDTGGICVSGYNLTVNIGGNCAGSIYNKERGDSTSGTKTYSSYASGDTVTLTATPGPYSYQSCKMSGGWSASSGGNCVGGTLEKNNTTDDTCKLTMGSADKSLSVSFDQSSSLSSSAPSDPGAFNLTLKKKGSGGVKLYAWRDSPWDDYGETVDGDFQNNETNGLKKDWWFKMTTRPIPGRLSAVGADVPPPTLKTLRRLPARTLVS